MTVFQTVVGDVSMMTIENDFLKADILSYGASIFHLFVKRNDEWIEVSVQPNDINEFITSNFYYGKTVGRAAGRLFYPGYTIDQTEYLFGEEENPALLHGGPNGFSFKHFDVVSFDAHHVTLKATSYEDEGPFDGELTLHTTYRLDNQAFHISYEAHTTAPTICNITNHVYLNVSTQSTIDHQFIKIDAMKYLNIDEANKIISVEDINVPFDFNQGKYFKDALNDMASTSFNGYDHTFIFNPSKRPQMEVTSDVMTMKLFTTNPAVVLYTHNKPSPHALRTLKANQNKHAAFTIETQYEPGGIQFEGLNDAILRPSETYKETTTLVFETK
jgi:aldose 1-epimerase